MERILVVDDHPVTLDDLEAMLTDHRFKVERATSSADALRKVRQNPPNAILLNLDMPMLDGWTLLKAQDTEPALKGVPIVAVAFTTETTSAARQFRPYACLRKPFQAQALVLALREACASVPESGRRPSMRVSGSFRRARPSMQASPGIEGKPPAAGS